MNGTDNGGLRLYRPAEVAAMLRCSEWWVKEQARHRRVPFCWIGGSYLFTEAHIVAIVALFEVRPCPQGPDVGTARPSKPDAADETHVPAPLRARRTRRGDTGKTAA